MSLLIVVSFYCSTQKFVTRRIFWEEEKKVDLVNGISYITSFGNNIY